MIYKPAESKLFTKNLISGEVILFIIIRDVQCTSFYSPLSYPLRSLVIPQFKESEEFI